jgi:hypothetical protein
MPSDFGIVLTYFVIYEAYFIVCGFCINIRVVSAYLFCLCKLRIEWARKCWSVMDMIRHVSAGPLWTCVKVADCCDPSFAGTLTKIFVSYLT